MATKTGGTPIAAEVCIRRAGADALFGQAGATLGASAGGAPGWTGSVHGIVPMALAALRTGTA